MCYKVQILLSLYCLSATPSRQCQKPHHCRVSAPFRQCFNPFVISIGKIG